MSLAPAPAPGPDQGPFAASVPAEVFKTHFRHHPGGVSLITAAGEAGPVALTATSVVSISADPPLLVFSVSDLSSSAPTVRAAETVIVHLLRATDLGLAQLGATSGVDRFADAHRWSTLDTGEPVFHGPPWLRLRVVNRFPTATSTLIVGHAVESSEVGADDRDGLVYVNRRWHRLGKHSLV